MRGVVRGVMGVIGVTDVDWAGETSPVRNDSFSLEKESLYGLLLPFIMQDLLDFLQMNYRTKIWVSLCACFLLTMILVR